MVEEAERQPVLAVWEDLQWIDPSSLEALDLVVEQTSTVPMLTVMTCRPEFAPRAKTLEVCFINTLPVCIGARKARSYRGTQASWMR